MRRVLKGLAIALALCVIGLALVPTAVRSDWLRVLLCQWVSAEIGRELSIQGGVVLEPSWRPRIRIRELRLANPSWGQNTRLAEIEELDVRFDLGALLQGRWVLLELSLTNPVLHLERSSAGTPNWIFGKGEGGTPLHITINRLTLQNGRLTYSDPSSAVYLGALITEQPVAANWWALVLHGSGLFQGGQFELALHTVPLVELLEQNQPFGVEGWFAWGRTHSRWAGTMESLLTLQGASLEVEMSGPSPAALFPLTHIWLPDLPPYHIRGHLTQRGKDWTTQNLQASVGNSDFAGAVTLEGSGKRPRWVGHLAFNHLDLKDIGIGQAAPTGSAVQPAPIMVDADLELRGHRVVTPLVLDDVQTHLHLEDGQLRLDPMDFGLAGGRGNAIASMDTHYNPMPIALETHFQRIDWKRLLANLGIVQQNGGILSGQMQFHSDGGDSLTKLLAHAEGSALFAITHGQLDSLLLALAQLDLTKTLTSLLYLDSSVELRCAVAGVRVHGGSLTVDPLVIDTTNTKVTGGGAVDLRNETLDLTFEPHPKDLSLFSAHSPFRVTGSFQSPEVRPAAGPLSGKVAAAAALGVLVGPVGAIMPFIEPGIGEDNDCQDLVRGVDPAPQNSAKTTAQ